jgi:hypothetical protein
LSDRIHMSPFHHLAFRREICQGDKPHNHR